MIFVYWYFNPTMLFVLKMVNTFMAVCVVYKPFRFYMMSFGFDWLYENPKIAHMCGIKIVDDIRFHTDRKQSHIYVSGFYAWLFGMDVIMTPEVFSEFQKVQNKQSGDINMSHYDTELKHQKMSLYDFEMWLSDVLLKETNRCFNIVDNNIEVELLKNNRLIRQIIGQEEFTIWHKLQNIRQLCNISLIFRSVPNYFRLFLIVPQLTLVDVTTKCMFEYGDKIKDETVETILYPNNKFFVMVCNDNLTFVKRDDSNTTINRAFGPKGFQCPANAYSLNFLQTIFDSLNKFDLTIEGEPTYTNDQFRHISNKKDIMMTFEYNDIEDMEDAEDIDDEDIDDEDIDDKDKEDEDNNGLVTIENNELLMNGKKIGDVMNGSFDAVPTDVLRKALEEIVEKSKSDSKDDLNEVDKSKEIKLPEMPDYYPPLRVLGDFDESKFDMKKVAHISKALNDNMMKDLCNNPKLYNMFKDEPMVKGYKASICKQD